jgi:penicillin amidase
LSRPLKIALGVVTVLVVLAVGLFLFARHLVTKSFPITSGTLALPGLYETVSVYRDELGVPHLMAQNEHDMFFAAGFVHAQDRLWQMDLTRRAGEGRLSEIFGKETLAFDKLFRTIGIRRIAEAMDQQLSHESRLVLSAYADGVNAFIRTSEGKLPVEFDMLEYHPEEWQPRHSLIAARMIAWELNLAWFTDITFGIIAEKVELSKASEIFPSWERNAPRIVAEASIDEMGSGFLSANSDFLAFMGADGLQGGSNCWAIGPERSATGKPLLANDLHLTMPAPARWYQIHLRCPDWNVAGVSLPGTPLVVIGRNDYLAWGVTNAMIDDADFFVEKLDSTRTMYMVQNRQIPVDNREETIYLGKDDSTVITVRSTRHGPLVDEVHSLLKNGNSSFRQYGLAMRWTGLDTSDEIHAFSLMNKARNAEEFENGLSHFAVPGQNFVYADSSGNIGYWTAGRIPIRGRVNPMIPLPGWTEENDWRGFVPFAQLPRLWNPPEGFIATANNKIASENYPYYISELWEPPSRIMRIRELLTTGEPLRVDDFKRFQMDVASPFGKEFVSHLLSAFENAPASETTPDAALEYLRNWHFRFERDDVASTIVSVTFNHFLKNVFLDEMGDSLFRQFVTFSAIPYRVTSQLLASENSSWFDDVATHVVETKHQILRKSLDDAVNELESTLGTDTRLWRWGTLHTVTFAHPFGSRKPLDRVFNIGPFPAGGSGTTINKAELRLHSPYRVAVGPSMRHIIDLGDHSSFLSVITSGQSGQALHTHYSDQTLLWLNGGYHTLVYNWETISQTTWDRLILEPR